MSNSVPDSKSPLFPSSSSTAPIEEKCASEIAEISCNAIHSESLHGKKSRSSSVESLLGDRSGTKSHLNVTKIAPGDLKTDHLKLSAGLENFSDQNSPHYTTNSKSMASPFALSRESNHNRLPSLGEIHQSVEEEQEAQVNRLLQMIHIEQQNLWHLRNANDYLNTHTNSDEAVIAPTHHAPLSPVRNSQNISCSLDTKMSLCSIDNNDRSDAHPNSTSSGRTASLGQAMTEWKEDGESFAWSFRDDPTVYQAESQMMTRENQMLRRRIRELEMQINELSPDPQ